MYPLLWSLAPQILLTLSHSDGDDIVPTLSIGVLRDFKNVATTLKEEGSIAQEIVARTVGLHQRLIRDSPSPSMEHDFHTDGKGSPLLEEKDQLNDWSVLGQLDLLSRLTSCRLYRFESLIRTLRASMHELKLLPAGDVYIMVGLACQSTVSSGLI